MLVKNNYRHFSPKSLQPDYKTIFLALIGNRNQFLGQNYSWYKSFSVQRILGAQNCKQFWEPLQSAITYKPLNKWLFQTKNPMNFRKNPIKKVEFRVIRRLTSRLFNWISIKSPFWPPSERFLQILISAIDSLDRITPWWWVSAK